MLEIQDFSFGKMVISGKTYTKDLKIGGDTIIFPWWRKEGHRVVLEDVEDLLKHDIEILILGQGEPGMMKSDISLKNYLKNKKITLIEKPTKDAISEFNTLIRKGRKIAAGFHLTC